MENLNIYIRPVCRTSLLVTSKTSFKLIFCYISRSPRQKRVRRHACNTKGGNIEEYVD